MNAPASGGLFVCIGLLLTVGLTGCGGGGNGGSSSTTTTTTTSTSPATVQVTLQNASGGTLSGDTLVYDRGTVSDPTATLTLTTASSGTATFTIPASDITGSDTLTAYNSAGGAVALQAVTLVPGQTIAVTVTATASSPPSVPPLTPSA